MKKLLQTLPLCGAGFLPALFFASFVPAQAQTETQLHAFQGTDGGFPKGGLTADAQGNLFGATPELGNPNCNCGTLFEITSTGTFAVLYAFPGNGGPSTPNGQPVLIGNTLYDTTSTGGSSGFGTIFSFNLQTQSLTILHDFSGADGAFPSSLVADAAGNLYGTTLSHASGQCGISGCGTLFKYARSGTFTTIYSFSGHATGGNPVGGLTLDPSGNYYVATGLGGGHDLGTIDKISPDGSQAVNLHSFSIVSGGYAPNAGLALDSTGNIYGTTGLGGKKNDCLQEGFSGCGELFEITASQGKYVSLYRFTGRADSGFPAGGVLLNNGLIYGTTSGVGPVAPVSWGTVWQFDPASSTLTTLYNFQPAPDGVFPESNLLLVNAQYLIGTTYQGGNGNCSSPTATGCGTVFKLKLTNR